MVLEMTAAINKTAAYFGKNAGDKDGHEEQDVGGTCNVRVIFGWCPPCKSVIDPAPT